MVCGFLAAFSDTLLHLSGILMPMEGVLVHVRFICYMLYAMHWNAPEWHWNDIRMPFECLECHLNTIGMP